MVDHQLIQKKLSVIREYTGFLDKIKNEITIDHLEEDFSLHLKVCHAIQTTVQACIDICAHLASDEGWELPDNSGHAMRIAQRHHVISEVVSENLQKAVKLRNVIVHQYDDLDYTILENVAKNHLNIFKNFITEVESWLKKKKN